MHQKEPKHTDDPGRCTVASAGGARRLRPASYWGCATASPQPMLNRKVRTCRLYLGDCESSAWSTIRVDSLDRMRRTSTIDPARLGVSLRSTTALAFD